MSEYPSIYRAKSTRWTGGVLHTLIPQIFGEADVGITQFLNAPTVGMGWVMFQGGDPEHPVWLGPITSTVSDGGDIIVIPDANDEVWVGPGTPPGDQELWIDTDEVSALTTDARWNTAWGLVVPPTGAGNTTVGGTVVTMRSATGTLVTGRRYRVNVDQLATYCSTVGDSWVVDVMLDGSVIGTMPYSVDYTNNYLPAATTLFLCSAATGSHVFELRVTRAGGTGTMQARFGFSVEDIGPVSGSVPVADPTPLWLPLTFTNGWTQKSDQALCRYRKIGDVVYVEGEVVAPPSAANPGYVALLPFGYRPPKRVQWGTVFWNYNAHAFGLTSVETSGAIVIGINVPFATGASGDGPINLSFSVTP